jgi:hypothetical protein
MDFLKMNELKVEEVAKGGLSHQRKNEEAIDEIRNDLAQRNKLDEVTERLFDEYAASNYEDTITRNEISDILNSNGLRNYGWYLNQGENRSLDATTKFSQYTLPGGENYRELLFTLPAKKKMSRGKLRVEEDENNVSGREYYRVVDEDNNVVGTYSKRKFAQDMVDGFGDTPIELDSRLQPEFKSSHWDEPNVFAHTRTNDRIVDGKKYLHIEEVQSDWVRSLRESSALRKVSEPESIAKFTSDIFGGQLPSGITFSQMDAGVLALRKYNQISEAIISLLPIDMVNTLGGKERTLKNFLGDKPMIPNSLPIKDRTAVIEGILFATRQIETRLRAKLLSGLDAGRDINILSTLKASDLTAREIIGVLSPNSLYHSDLFREPIGSSATLSRAKDTPTSGERTIRDIKRLPTSDTEFLNTSISTGLGTETSSRKASSLDVEGTTTSITKALDWHNKILSDKLGSLVRVSYKPSETKSMPFENIYHEFVLKNLLRKAAEEGYDGITWVTGQQTADRYDLSKQVDEVAWQPKEKELYVVKKNEGTYTKIADNVSETDLERYVGKDVAQKLIESEPLATNKTWKTVKGDNLKIGAEWAKTLYDKVIPNFLNKYAKKWNAKVGEIDIEPYPARKTPGFFETKELAEQYIEENNLAGAEPHLEKRYNNRYSIRNVSTGSVFTLSETTHLFVHSLPITESMKQDVLFEGQPMFSAKTPLEELHDRVYSDKNFQDSPKSKETKRENEEFGAMSGNKSINEMIKNRRVTGSAKAFIISERAKQILKDFDIPINEKLLSRRYLGLYKLIPKTIRVQRIYDVVTVVHEVTHALDFRHKISDRLINLTTRGDALRKQLTDIYEELYPTGKRNHPLSKRMIEGLATFIENYFYDPVGTAKYYPLLVDNFINPQGQFYHPDITKLLDKMNLMVDDYAKLKPNERIGARLVGGKEIVKRKDKGFDFWQRTKFELFNIFEPFERYSKQLGIRRTWDDPTVSAFNYLGRGTIAYNWIQGNAAPVLKPDGNWEFRTETVDQYQKLVKDKPKEFEEYLVARRDIELYNKMVKLKELNKDLFAELKEATDKGDVKALRQLLNNPIIMEVQRIDDIIKNDDFSIQDMQATVDEFGTEFEEATKIYDKINLNLIDFSENTGLISSETANNWRAQKGYASFQRFINDELLEVINTPSSNARRNLKAGKKRTGGKLDIIFPTYNQILAINETIGKGLHNMMWKKVYDMSLKAPSIARRFEKIETISVIENGRLVYPQENNPNLLRILDRGKRIFVRPAPEFAMLNEAMKPQELDSFLSILRVPSQIFTRLTTSANPLFALSNLPIDQVTLAYNTHHGTIPVATQIKNVGNLAKHFADWLSKINSDKKLKAEGLEQYLLLGGQRQTLSGFYDFSPEELQKVIAQDRTKLQKAVGVVDSGLHLLELPTNWTEYSSRWGEYRNALEEGKSMSEAMYAAAQATLPFQQYGNFGGKAGRGIVKSIPYFNPSLLALYRYMKAGKDNPLRFVTLTAGLLATALTAAIYVMVEGDDEDRRNLGNISAEEFARALYIPNPFGKGLFRLRIPEQVGAFTGLAYLYVIDHYGGNEATFKDYAKSLSSVIPKQFNVVQPSEMVMSWIPQLAKPSVEVAVNTRTFPDLLPIEQDWQIEQYAPEDRYNDYTSYIAKETGKQFGLSPLKIDHWIRNQFGVVGNFLMGFGDFVQGDFERIMRSNPAYRKENTFTLMGRAYNHFYDKKEFYLQEYNKLKGEHSYSDEEADRIKSTKKLYEDFSKQLTDARASAKEEALDKETRKIIWEGILLLEQDKFDEVQEIVDQLNEILPDKPKKKAKYKSGDEIELDNSGVTTW